MSVSSSVVDILKQRRTIRNFDPDAPIPKEALEIIANAGLDAPTAMNCQEIDLIVIKNKDKIKQISKATYESMNKSQQAYFDVRRGKYAVRDPITCDAPVVVLLVKNERAQNGFVGVDCGNVLMSMITAAQSLGFGSMSLGCIVSPKVEEVYGLEKGSLLMGLAIGKVNKRGPILDPKERKCKVTFVE